MESLSEYRRSAGAVHSIGWPIVWCPKYGERIRVGPVADRLRGMLHVHLFVRTPGDVSVAHQQTTGPVWGER